TPARLGDRALGADRADDEARRRLDVAGPVDLAGIAAAADQRVELDAGLRENRKRARRRRQHARSARMPKRAGVACREIDAVEAGELAPGQRILAPRPEALPD